MCALPVRIAFAGSRACGPGAAPAVAALLARVPAGASLGVGCAVGVDQLVLSRCLASSRSAVVFAAGSATGAGFWPGSAPRSLLSSVGRPVRWLAGGPLSLPLPARLARRTQSLVRWAAAGAPGSALVAVVAQPLPPGGRGSGTWLAVSAAAAAGLPVVVCLVPPVRSSLPPLPGGGSWVPAGAPWAGCLPGSVLFSWAPAGAGQLSLFS